MSGCILRVRDKVFVGSALFVRVTVVEEVSTLVFVKATVAVPLGSIECDAVIDDSNDILGEVDKRRDLVVEGVAGGVTVLDREELTDNDVVCEFSKEADNVTVSDAASVAVGVGRPPYAAITALSLD